MDIDSKCYEAIAGAGLEPILQGGRGQASGFIMRMMAENKLKHKGQYKNPSTNDYGSKMNQFRAFDIKRLANRDQKGVNTSDYGASPFIIKHFGSPEAVPFIPKAERYGEENKVIEGETEEQKAARLQKKAEELAEKAKELLEAATKKGKVKKFLSGVVGVKRAKKAEEALTKEKEKEAREAQKTMARKQQVSEVNRILNEAEAYAKELRKEWNDKWVKGLADYFSYGKRDVESALRDAYRSWLKKHIKARFGARWDAIDDENIGWQKSEQYYKVGETYDDGRRPSRGYNYKPMPYGEAKKIYDEFLADEREEETEAEKAERLRGLKGVVRRIITTKKNLKAMTSVAGLPQWWNGVRCVEAWAKQHRSSSTDKSTYERDKWFGKWGYSMLNNITGNKWLFGEDAPVYPPESTKRLSEEKQRERNAIIQKANEKYREGQTSIVNLTEKYYEWVFTKALPLFGYKFIEYHPREEDFPKQPHYESREIEPLYTGRYTYDKTRDITSFLRQAISGITSYSTRPAEQDKAEASIKPIPADFKLHLLVRPEGDFAWMIGTKTEGGWDNPQLDWKTLVEQSLGIGRHRGQGDLSFHAAFVKNGDHWKHLVLKQTEDSKHSYIPIKLPKGGEYKWETRLTSKKIQEIIEPVITELDGRKEWDGTPLVKQEFKNTYFYKKKPKVKITLPKDDEEELKFDKPPKGASWEAVKAYINATATGQKLERSVALYRHLHPSKNEREVAKETGVSQPSVNRWKNRFPDE